MEKGGYLFPFIMTPPCVKGLQKTRFAKVLEKNGFFNPEIEKVSGEIVEVIARIR